MRASVNSLQWNTVIRWSARAAILAVLYLTSQYSFPFFRSLIELFCISISVCVFVLVWNARSIMQNDYFVYFGIILVFSAGIELFHLLAFLGRGILPGNEANLSAQLWIVSRYFLALSLLVAPVFFRRRLPVGRVLLVDGLLVILLLGVVFSGRFPVAFRPGGSPTRFTEISLATETCLILFSLGGLYFMHKGTDGRIFSYSMQGVAALAFADVFFNLGAAISAQVTLLGWFSLLVAYYLFYKAMIETALQHPFQLVFRDLHEHERALQESEQRYRGIVEHSGDGIVLTDEQGTIVEWNPAQERLTGISRSEAIGKFLGEIEERFSPKGPSSPESPAGQGYAPMLLSPGEQTHRLDSPFDIKIFREGRGRLDAQCQGFFIQTEKGAMLGGIWRDMTLLRRTEEELRSAQEFLARLLNYAPTPIFALSAQGKYQLVNRAWEEYFGKSRDEAIGRTVFQVLPPEVAAIFAETNRRVIDEGQAIAYDTSAPLDSGERYHHTVKFPLFSPNGEIESVAGMTIDLTERKRAEDTLARSRDFYLSLLEKLPNPIWRTDPENKNDYYNRAYLEYTGRTLEEEIELGWPNGIHPEDFGRVMRENWDSFRERRPFEIEYRYRRGDGEYRWVVDFGSPFDDLDGNFAGYIGSFYDVTERREAEDELRHLAGHLEAAREEERTRIAREIHDDFGQQLTALKLDLAWLVRHLPATEERTVKKAHSMLAEIDSCIQVVRRIATELRPGLLDNFGLAAAVEWQVQDFAERMGIAWNVDLGEEEFALDREQATTVFRILQETLTNVARHAQASAVQVTLQETPEEIVLTVTDNGRGITPEQVTHPGSLGLVGMRERVRFWGGRLEIDGRPGNGTIVRMRMPLAFTKEKHE